MLPVLRLYLKTTRAHLCLYICTVVMPVIVMAAVALFFSFEDRLQSTSNGLRGGTLPRLPLCKDLPGCTSQTVYLAFSPDTVEAHRIIDRLAQQNGLGLERIVAVKDRATMQKLVAGKNLGPSFVDNVIAAGLGGTIRGHLLSADGSLASAVAPREVLADRGVVAEMLGTAYGLDSRTLDAFDSEWAASMGPADGVFLALDLNISRQGASDLPQAIQYSLWYSQEMMARYAAKHPSPRTKSSAPNSYAMSYVWSPVSFSVFEAIHNALTGAFIDKTISYSLEEYPSQGSTTTLAGMQAYMILQLSVFLECILTLIFAAHFRGPFQTTLRRLGVSEFCLYGLTFGTLLAANLLAYGLLFGAGSLFKLFPFSNYTPSLNALVSITLALITTASVLLLHMLFYNTSVAIAFGTVALALLVVFPFLILLEEPSFPTIWTQLVVPTWLTKVFYALLPPLGLVAICDMMVTLRAERTSAELAVSTYSQYGFEILFTDINNYHSNRYVCSGTVSLGTTGCTFQLPYLGSLIVTSLIQSALALPLLTLVLLFCKHEPGAQGLPVGFLCSRKFYRTRRPKDNPELPLLSVSGLRKTYRKAKRCTTVKEEALCGLDLHLEQGEVTGLVATSGGGKSTALGIMAGELASSGGQCAGLGHDLLCPYAARSLRGFISLCPQEWNNIWVNLTVRENVLLCTEIRARVTGRLGELRDRDESLDEHVDKLLKRLGLHDHADKQASALSGGMLRRLALANATVGGPRLILLDEITVGVDPVLKRQIWAYVRALVAEGAAAVLSSHDANEIAELATRVVVLKAGQTQASASVVQLLEEHGDYVVSVTSESHNGLPRVALLLSTELGALLGAGAKELGVTVGPRRASISIPAALVPDAHALMGLVRYCRAFEERECAQAVVSRARLEDVFEQMLDGEDDAQSDPLHSVAPGKDGKPSATRHLLLLFLSLDLREHCRSFASIIAALSALFVLIWMGVRYTITSVISASDLIEAAQLSFWSLSCLADCINANPGADPLLIDASVTAENVSEFLKANSGVDALQVMERCLVKRPRQLFEPMFQYQGESPICLSYMNHLGLDTYRYDYLTVGDRQTGSMGLEETQFSWYYIGAVGDALGVETSDSVSLSLSPDDPLIAGSPTRGLDYYIASEAQQISFSPQNFGDVWRRGIEAGLRHPLDSDDLFSFVAPRMTVLQYLHSDTSVPRTDAEDYTLLLEETILRQPAASDFFEGITSTIGSTFTKPDYFDSQPAVRARIVRKLFRNIPAVIFQPGQHEASGALLLKMYTMLPPLGPQSKAYRDWAITFTPSEERTNPQTLASRYLIPTLFQYLYKSVKNAIDITKTDRFRFTFTTIGADAMAKMTGALFRQHLMESLQGTLGAEGAWRRSTEFTYDGSVMSIPRRYLNRNILLETPGAALQSIEIMSDYYLVFLLLLGSVIVAGRAAREFQQRTVTLLHLHGASEMRVVVVLILYFSIWAIIPTVLITVALTVLFKDSFFTHGPAVAAVAYTCLGMTALSSVFNAVLVAVLLRSQQNAMLTVVLQILLAVFVSGSLRAEGATAAILGLLAPGAGYMPVLRNAIGLSSISWGSLVFSFLVSLLEVFASFCVLLLRRIRARQRVKDRVPEGPDSDGSGLLSRLSAAASMTSINLEKEDAPSGRPANHLSVQGASHSYRKGTHALDDASFSVPSGSIFALLGANGAGKSTMMHALTGVLRPAAGTALCVRNEADSRRVDLFRRVHHSRYITVVPQHDLYWSQLTVRDHVKIIRGLTPGALRPNIKSTDHVLCLVGLAEHADKRAGALSGGMRRRLTLAMVLVSSPSLICLDEATTGFSGRLRKRVWDAILASKGANKTLIVTSHDMAEVEALADTCCVLRKGRVIASGSVDDLCAQSRVAYTLTVACGSLEALDAHLAGPHKCVCSLAGELLADAEVNSVARLVKYRIPQGADLETAISSLSSAGCLTHAWTLTHARLEEAFIDLTGC
ncbi:ABC transporter ABCA.1, putative [Giardia lamblia P15]|uniref:ABC transporter ABCA.1, putative n=1 Tax=Giardia intestinalis (strain P15) TaxID=658858 RepID=E1F5R0_GIAIA|nr:ABC transporter ABCA.1, putative [Giardia lamblia P15]